mgnify:CR=1 FL=1
MGDVSSDVSLNPVWEPNLSHNSPADRQRFRNGYLCNVFATNVGRLSGCRPPPVFLSAALWG